MQMSDVIADMLTRIRNANDAKHATVDIPASNMKKAIAEILVNEGYVKSFEVIEDGKQGVIRITLKYQGNKQKVLRGIRRVSKPGLRIYASCEDMPQRYERTRHRYRIHLKGHHDRQAGSQRECWRRSACLCMVSKEAEICQE